MRLRESPGGLYALGFSWRLPLSGAGPTGLISRFRHITETGIASEAAAPILEVLSKALTPQLELF